MTIKPLIIFDFDGVLADSFDTFYPFIKDGMKHVGLKLSALQYRNFFIDNVHKSFKNFINDDEKFETFLKFRNENYKKYCNHNLFPEANNLIKNIHKDYAITIASSGRVDIIIALLKKNKIYNLFDMVLADSKYSKEDMINKILNKYKKRPEDSYFITDTVGDIKVAKKMNLKTIATTWGFHNKKTLALARPKFIASSFDNLDKMLYSRAK